MSPANRCAFVLLAFMSLWATSAEARDIAQVVGREHVERAASAGVKATVGKRPILRLKMDKEFEYRAYRVEARGLENTPVAIVVGGSPRTGFEPTGFFQILSVSLPGKVGHDMRIGRDVERAGDWPLRNERNVLYVQGERGERVIPVSGALLFLRPSKDVFDVALDLPPVAKRGKLFPGVFPALAVKTGKRGLAAALIGDGFDPFRLSNPLQPLPIGGDGSRGMVPLAWKQLHGEDQVEERHYKSLSLEFQHHVGSGPYHRIAQDRSLDRLGGYYGVTLRAGQEASETIIAPHKLEQAGVKLTTSR
jgi:hypothetical protein